MMKRDMMGRGYIYWNAVLSNVKDDSELAYAASLDALSKWENNGEALTILMKILEEHYVLSPKKLEGITFALLEYQLIERIPEDVIERLKKVVETRIFDDTEGEEKQWIQNILKLIMRQFSTCNFRWIISVLIDPNRKIPSSYVDNLISVLSEYIMGYGRNPEFRGYIVEEITRIQNDLLRFKMGKESVVRSDDKTVKLQLIAILSSKDSWLNFNKNSLTRLRIRIREFISSVLSDNSTMFSFVSVTALVTAPLGYFINNKWGAIVFPGVYAIIIIILIQILRRKYQATSVLS